MFLRFSFFRSIYQSIFINQFINQINQFQSFFNQFQSFFNQFQSFFNQFRSFFNQFRSFFNRFSLIFGHFFTNVGQFSINFGQFSVNFRSIYYQKTGSTLTHPRLRREWQLITAATATATAGRRAAVAQVAVARVWRVGGVWRGWTGVWLENGPKMT
jgi:hypothetical protein